MRLSIFTKYCRLLYSQLIHFRFVLDEFVKQNIFLHEHLEWIKILLKCNKRLHQGSYVEQVTPGQGNSRDKSLSIVGPDGNVQVQKNHYVLFFINKFLFTSCCLLLYYQDFLLLSLLLILQRVNQGWKKEFNVVLNNTNLHVIILDELNKLGMPDLFNTWQSDMAWRMRSDLSTTTAATEIVILVLLLV